MLFCAYGQTYIGDNLVIPKQLAFTFIHDLVNFSCTKLLPFPTIVCSYSEAAALVATANCRTFEGLTHTIHLYLRFGFSTLHGSFQDFVYEERGNVQYQKKRRNIFLWGRRQLFRCM